MRSMNGAARLESMLVWRDHRAERASGRDGGAQAGNGRRRVLEWLGRRALAAQLGADQVTQLSRWSGGRC